MSLKQCQICFSYKTIFLKDTIYCEMCDIYYTLSNGKQYINSLPIKALSQVSLNLCNTCKIGNINNKRKIQCKTFHDYFTNIKFCKNCKMLNKDFLKNLFYKNFLLYKKQAFVFSWLNLLVLLLLYYFYGKSKVFNLCMLIVTEYTRYKLSFLNLLGYSFAIYKLGHLEFFRAICLIYAVVCFLTSKITIFEVPANLYNHDELYDFIGKLRVTPFKEDNKIYIDKKFSLSFPAIAKKDNII